MPLLYDRWALVLLVAVQAVSGQNWWDLLTTTSPIEIPTEQGPGPAALTGNSDISNTCCECVPFYLCSPNNTIIVGGEDIIGPRFGSEANRRSDRRVTNVEMCPEITDLCCRPAVVPERCATNGTRVAASDTQCDCTHWEFCLEEFRISDGSPSKTFMEGKPLVANAKCPHSLEVCCALDPDSTPDVEQSTNPPPRLPDQCICVNNWLCDADGFIVTSGEGILNLRTSKKVPPPCVPPLICCSEPLVPPSRNNSNRKVDPPHIPVITDQGCCGVRNSQGIAVRISGFMAGESQFGEFPWVAMVLRTHFVAGAPTNAFIGGAILVHPRILLTAAHKVANEAVASLTIRVGEWDIETDFEPAEHQIRSVERVIIHPSFNNRTLYHDVALLILSEPVILQPHIRSICLASSMNEVNPAACVINGWGEDSFQSGNYQTVMKSVTLPLVAPHRCQEQLRQTRLGRWFELHPSFVCAGGKAGVDACRSDGGGPLACPRLGSTIGEYLLVGITAWGIGCGQEGVPGVYASTVADNSWITAQMANVV